MRYDRPTFNWSKWAMIAAGLLVFAYMGLVAILWGD